MVQKKILVSGVSGYVGANVANEFLMNGYKVRGSVRSISKSKEQKPFKDWLKNKDFELVEANLADAESWKAAVKGCDFVAHTASPFFVGCKDEEAEEKLFKPAKDGTLFVLKAAQECGTVKRVVLTSSMAAIAAGHPEVDYLEKPDEQWSNMEKADNYSKSKTMAESAAWDYLKNLENPNFTLSTINPTLVIGAPLTSGFATSHELPKRIIMRLMPGVPDVRMNGVDVKDVAKAHRLALEKDTAQGKRFPLSPQQLKVLDWAKAAQNEFSQYGFNPPTFKIPYFILYGASFFDKTLKETLPLIGKKEQKVNMKNAKEILGLEFTDLSKSYIEHIHSCLQLKVPGFEATNQYKEKFM